MAINNPNPDEGPAAVFDPAVYEAARTGAWFLVRPSADRLRLSGADRVDFLQRQSTNDLDQLTPGRALLTVLISPTARILDALLLTTGEDELLALTLPGRSQATAVFLRGKIFFMDQVSVTEANEGHLRVDLGGPQAAQVLQQAFELPLPPDREAVVTVEIDGTATQILSQPAALGGGMSLIAPKTLQAQLAGRLGAAGALEIPPAVYEILRVEGGVPGPATELTEAFTPLEVGLDAAVSQTKGCYTGQEVIARQITYDKVTRRLVGVRLGAEAAVGDKIWVDGKAVGQVTSAVRSPRLGPIALAVVRRPHHRPGTPVSVGNRDASTQAEVVALPFTIT